MPQEKTPEKMPTPLSNLQMELLKLYSTNLTDEELRELKQQLARYYAEKAIKAADQKWEEDSLSQKAMKEWLNPFEREVHV